MCVYIYIYIVCTYLNNTLLLKVLTITNPSVSHDLFAGVGKYCISVNAADDPGGGCQRLEW